MPGFYADAQQIFETAQCGPENTEFALLLMPNGAVRMVMNSPFSLEGVTADTGAATAYHVRRTAQSVSVKGISKSERCVFESVRPNVAAANLLRDRPLYEMSAILLA